MTAKTPHDPSLFQSTAQYYTRYRPSYPALLFADIAKHFGLNDNWPGNGTLLDLGCGTGEMTLPLCKYFEQVYAWDPDPDMLIEARRNARAVLTPRQLRKITTEQKSSDDLSAVSTRSFKAGRAGLRLVTMGQSFHWMDKRVVLQQLLPLIQSGGGLVIVSGMHDVEQNQLSARKNQLQQATVKKYLGPQRRAGKAIYNVTEESYYDLLADTGFREPIERIYQYTQSFTVDQVVGHLFSLSWASKYQLGNQAAAFEAEFRQGLAGLLADAGAQQFEDRIAFSCYVARRGL